MATSKAPTQAKADKTVLDGVPITNNVIAQRFRHHPPDAEAQIGHERIYAATEALAQIIKDTCPGNDAAAIAINKVQEACMWANQSVALRGKV